ncbi:hypothetical protein GCM10023194_49570 [Planotetraspora phitsanulokensis]|uniref:Uncharacterized protein n=1 Tax=Planotetraspora phitsanulokensis TaxID=575192 RepID=A0A8J3XDT7_9ACTN|nr:hypothetical protein [Planotetraspora phitsanulokensis]GII36964.1 hypothetical protein Pph01_19670 [Planotetraspora phitsanulokensis]
MHADGRDYNVITLRPGAGARYSTNRYHETWHILSDIHGARLLGRLLWGLSYQRRPGTLVVIGPPHLDANPFDAEPADPIALVPSHLTTLPARAATSLRRRLATPATPDGTVRWHTWGLDPAVAEMRAWRPGSPHVWRPAADPYGVAIDRVGGLLTFRGSPAVLREWAVDVARVGDFLYKGMDYTYLGSGDEPGRWSAGEVQVFGDYRQRVSVARVSRREVLAGVPADTPADDVNPLVWDHNKTVRARRLPAVTA